MVKVEIELKNEVYEWFCRVMQDPYMQKYYKDEKEYLSAIAETRYFEATHGTIEGAFIYSDGRS